MGDELFSPCGYFVSEYIIVSRGESILKQIRRGRESPGKTFRGKLCLGTPASLILKFHSFDHALYSACIWMCV